MSCLLSAAPAPAQYAEFGFDESLKEWMDGFPSSVVN